MRLFAEVISAEVEQRNITDRKTGKENMTSIFVIHAMDIDQSGRVFKISVWENFSTIVNKVMKSATIEVIFRNLKPANDYEKLDQISTNEGSIKVRKTVAEALQEMQKMITAQQHVVARENKPVPADMKQ